MKKDIEETEEDILDLMMKINIEEIVLEDRETEVMIDKEKDSIEKINKERYKRSVKETEKERNFSFKSKEKRKNSVNVKGKNKRKDKDKEKDKNSDRYNAKKNRKSVKDSNSFRRKRKKDNKKNVIEIEADKDNHRRKSEEDLLQVKVIVLIRKKQLKNLQKNKH